MTPENVMNWAGAIMLLSIAVLCATLCVALIYTLVADAIRGRLK
jgi:hypothetical protein